MRRQTYPPLSKAELEKLRADAGDIPGVAKRRNVTLDAWDLRSESAAAKQHFALGCWLYYYSQRIGLTGPQGLRDRIDCARRIFEAGFANPGYAFFTVFHFGEREFDTLFEMGDGAAVVDALRKLARKSQHQHIKEAFAELGWSLAPVVVQNASQIQLAL
ncbi:hypothetical protein [Noviherbaspirillum pedocola]|uniref:Uncharacterized protein n=1 Tax=Noviherbaspirillum pedocola TaxID=2801341 RepID=A0A934SY26_9BURK|nr:hypothetical protein [Noviherbaspirillum pedocola]MBK4738660.1 hypothetical protein [Noviherbaspirillum pedocola]